MPVLKQLWLLAALLLLLAACRTTTPISATDASCLAYEPIRYSRTDTAETRRQIIEHNAAWDALCRMTGKDGARPAK
jgi:hypothetical protein